ncbi:hypothetical protein PFICI_01127 [Pestalotiopsis fici W106-1]|uniref:Methyltransferase domain-containing protein n=1 Tax=Pestalotiopsis fici (strain W106-1 / CGMCC3.15140) TaxID=1229662 RepID=W3XMU0_PESFW|nr:uncharacterized protein PFICI_01127 [Pestalotiopsis fici W106-1]ETS87299.1 hypothetical protein PFICI_01127 [Pestalotiopsis fici W106-1]
METNYPEITDDSDNHSSAAWSYADSSPEPNSFVVGPDLLPYPANPMSVPAYVFPSELISAVRRSQQTYRGAVENTSATPWMNFMSQGAWNEANPPIGHVPRYSTESRGIQSWYTTQAPPAYNIYSQNPINNAISLPGRNMGPWNVQPSPGANSLAFAASSSVPISSVQSPFHSSEASWLREVDGAFDRNPDGSSIHETGSIYLAENERYYHRYNEGSYWFPNDAEEQDRLDFQHAMFRIMTGDKLALAPVKAPSNVMDVGTGTGIWAIEFAKENPDSQVYGMDLSAIQPAEHGAPNCSFEVDDAEEEWAGYPMFDYVHLRFVNVCFYNPKAVMDHAFRNLNPGGWIEYQDYDPEFKQANPHYKGMALIRWYQMAIRGALMKGRNILIARQYKQMMQEIGFVDVHEENIQVPVGKWMDDQRMKTVGQYMHRNVLDGLRGPYWKMMRAAGLSPQEIDAFIAEVRSELSDEKNNSYCRMIIIWGRKP